MTPAARHAAAIDVLDRFLAGEPAEKALTSWARASRYAGAKDRAAVRDLVFDALRCLRSHAALGGAMTGRGLVLGGLRARGADPSAVFTGERHAPAPLGAAEAAAGQSPEGLEALDCPDWLAPLLRESLGPRFEPVMRALRRRAPLHLRVNLRKATRAQAAARLAAEGIATLPHPLSPAALEVTGGARAVERSATFAEGWIEPQDAASQAAADTIPLAPGARVLDYCAGGGGKTLALAGRAEAAFFAHDAAPQRMRDLPARAARAGVAVRILADPAREAPFDVVLCDVPCSGSGAWRRAPEGKWRLDRAGLDRLLAAQDRILDAAAPLVAPGGLLAYVTCSLIGLENDARIAAFLDRTPGWRLAGRWQWCPGEGGDGFFAAHLTREPPPAQFA
ncbi:MAG: RsmB/NOP family class I SAM-dependent RNA methyltransferase [Rhodobacteraceae bacterium]|nr:RsmB/NOP family class I SAM-dependent RNA methyltransferase [Paracoccaceae bacterium]